MRTRFGWVVMLALAFSVVATEEVQAQCGFPGGGYGYGFGYDVGRLYGVLAQNVPHYAAFPPVYYSAPVPRSYGYSPFAYPPGTRTPELLSPTVAAKEILNPFVRASEVTKKATKIEVEDKVTQSDSILGPLVIRNPFVESSVDRPALHAVALNR